MSEQEDNADALANVVRSTMTTHGVPALPRLGCLLAANAVSG